MKREVIIVGGKTGWGKTLWTKVYSHVTKRLLAFDPSMSFQNVNFGEEETKVSQSFPDIAERSLDEGYSYNPNDRGEHVGPPLRNFRVGIIEPDRVSEIGSAAFVLGDCLLVLEETSMLFEKGQRSLDPWLRRLVFLGRHRRCSILCIAQRFMSVPIDIRSQANRVISFNQTEPEDIKYLTETFGKEIVGKIPTLSKYHCYDVHNGEVFSYSIEDAVRKTLGIKLDKEEQTCYSPFNYPH